MIALVTSNDFEIEDNPDQIIEKFNLLDTIQEKT